MKTRLSGARRVRRLLKRLPDDVRTEMAGVLQQQGPIITAYARAAAPRRTGKLERAIDWRVRPKSLSLRVGLLTKKVASDLFYARILEFGRKAKTVVAKRRTRAGRIAYRLRVKPIARDRYDFLSGRARRFAIESLRPRLDKVWTRALANAAGGDE